STGESLSMSNPLRPVRLLLLAAALLTAAGPVAAQVADAVIDILVSDESGAPLPGVTVTVMRPDTGYQIVLVSDVVGTVRALGLAPGTYEVKLDLAGFGSVIEKGLTVRVGQTARLGVTLRVAQLAETVNVVAEAPLVDIFKTDSSTNIVPEQ